MVSDIVEGDVVLVQGRWHTVRSIGWKMLDGGWGAGLWLSFEDGSGAESDFVEGMVGPDGIEYTALP